MFMVEYVFNFLAYIGMRNLTVNKKKMSVFLDSDVFCGNKESENHKVEVMFACMLISLFHW